jgi:glycosyltransferase involved in cell wall biosynthesis
MQVGTAVIGANRGGVLEIIDDNETGLLFESQNAHSLAQQITRLYNDEPLRERLAVNGKEKAQTSFSNELQFHKLATFLHRL